MFKTIKSIPLFWVLIGWWAILPYCIIMWLLGFWKCYGCGKTYWANRSKYKRKVYNKDIDMRCDESFCHTCY